MLARKTKAVVAMTSNRYNPIIYSWILQALNAVIQFLKCHLELLVRAVEQLSKHIVICAQAHTH